MKKLSYYLIALFVVIGCQKDDTQPVEEQEGQNEDVNITTSLLTNITQIKATTGGIITGVEISEIDSQGIVLSLTNNPTTDDTVVINETIALNYSVEILNLEVDTQYFVKSFITVDNETFYGDELVLNTLEHKEFNAIVTLTSQSNIDAFFSEGWSKISGFIIEEEVDGDITDLSAMSSLLEIGEAGATVTVVDIKNNSSLQGLEGLHNVTTIGGGIVLSNNALIDISALGNLTIIDRLGIGSEPLTNLNGLNNVTTITDALSIGGNNQLTSLEDLGSLTSIGNMVLINSNDSLQNYCSLTTALASVDNSYDYNAFGNAFNPTLEDLQNGNCSL
ncbi:hypothetical protein ULMS_04440 [Patiriisocius marinistellae]|uniref:Receptor L-domain domain-containing protein n=1 Tax=Patiriisocius marinistellae TaxID=2494560 RepID=A0A5J4FXR3_9FLAO|nr:hypothetical protein [Patiriisocius marinistellae]GEQ84936.1 hypothetical protein ULMS_04440 [Patiriisocius marinistellae]